MNDKFKAVLAGVGGIAVFVSLYFFTTMLGSKGMFLLPFVLFTGAICVLALAGDMIKKLTN